MACHKFPSWTDGITLFVVFVQFHTFLSCLNFCTAFLQIEYRPFLLSEAWYRYRQSLAYFLDGTVQTLVEHFGHVVIVLLQQSLQSFVQNWNDYGAGSLLLFDTDDLCPTICKSDILFFNPTIITVSQCREASNEKHISNLFFKSFEWHIIQG